MKYIIRSVKVSDLDSLYKMLLDLVKYEGLIERFNITRERLETELFNQNSDWNSLVATDQNDELTGFCLYTFCNINRAFNLTPMIQIDDFYISPEHRNKGIGRKLIHELAIVAKNKNITRLNLWCVKDNLQGQEFYKKIGGKKLDFIDIFSIQVNEIS